MHLSLHLFSKKASYMAVSQGIKTKMLWFKLHRVILIKCENILEYIFKKKQRKGYSKEMTI